MHRLFPRPAASPSVTLHLGRRAGGRSSGCRQESALYILDTMQVLIELDEDTLQRLEEVAPAKSRRRSAFIRSAIRKSLWELEEEKTRRAYLRAPDAEPAPFDPDAWEPNPYGGFEPPAAPATRSRGDRPRTRATRQAKSPRARK
jgi:predicted transcriptional regulator